MILIFIAVCGVLFAVWTVLQSKFGRIAKGAAPLVVLHRTDLPIDQLRALRKGVKRDSVMGLPCTEEETQPGIWRCRIYEDDARTKVINEVVFERMGGSEEEPIIRMVRDGDTPYPLGQDHYYVLLCVENDGQTALVAEERGQFGSVMKTALRALEIKLYLRNAAKGKYTRDEAKQTAAYSGNATAESGPWGSRQGNHARTSLVDEDKARLAPGTAGTSGAKKRGKAAGDYSQEIMLSILAFGSFALWLGWEGALLLAPMVLLHEYGHLLAYQLTGKTGNRMMLLPFFGGVAIAGENHKNEFERAFCAIMGPAICLPLSVALTAGAFHFEGSDLAIGGYGLWWWFSYGAIICAFGNAINLAPVMPLDGGHVMQSITRSISPDQAKAAMMVLTGVGAFLMFQAGYTTIAAFVAIVGLPALLGPQNDTLPPLSFKGGSMMLIAHVATLAIHLGCAWLIYDRFY